MKAYILLIMILFSDLLLNAQQRDLNYYLEQAKTNSPLINRSRNEKKIVELDLNQVKAVLSKPEINVNSALNFAPIISHDNNTNRFQLVSAGASSYNGYDLAITDGGHWEALVSARQPLLSGSKYRAYSDRAAISGQAAENDIALTIHDLEQVVGYQYLLCIKSKMQIDNNVNIISVLTEQLRILQKLVDNAVYKQTDLMLLQIEVQNFQTELEAFRGEYRTNLFDLNQICGINDTALVELKDLNLVLNTGKIAYSGFLKSYRLDSLGVVADQAIDELKYKPQLDLYADAGLMASYLPYLSRLGFSTGLTLSWNIFDGHQRDIMRAKSKINLQTIDFEKNSFITRNETGRNNLLAQMKALDTRITLKEQQEEKYRQLYNVYSKELSLGEVSVMDYKNLLKDIAAYKQEILLLKMEKQLLISSYNYLNY